MIDIQNEGLLTFAQVARALPPRRQGRPVNASTVHRWVRVGLRGVRLESIQVGGGRCTSIQALQRFFDRLSQLDGDHETLFGRQPARAPQMPYAVGPSSRLDRVAATPSAWR